MLDTESQKELNKQIERRRNDDCVSNVYSKPQLLVNRKLNFVQNELFTFNSTIEFCEFYLFLLKLLLYYFYTEFAPFLFVILMETVQNKFATNL